MKKDNAFINKRIKTPWFLTSVIISFFVVMTILLHPVFESFILNKTGFWFSLSDFCPVLLLCALGSLCILIILAFLLPDFGRKLIFGMLFAVTLCAYLQVNFLNPDYGTLDGREIIWARYGNSTINTMVWVCIIIGIVCLLLFQKNKLPRRIVTFISGILIAMQTVSLIVMLVTSTGEAGIKKEAQTNDVLNRDGINEVASSDNIIFFLVDSFDVQYMQAVMETPWINELEGFVFYDNCVGSYSKTATAVPFLITGQKYYNEIPVDEYYQNAFANSDIIASMKKHGYRTDYYTENFKGIVEVADNTSSKGKISLKQAYQVVQLMERLSLFKVAPQIFKPFFYLSSSDFSHLNEKTEDIYLMDDKVYYTSLKNEGLTVSDYQKAMKFIHLIGTHEPHIYSADVEEAVDNGKLDQIGATMNILTTYLNKLKQTNRYDDAIIVIVGDHGHYWTTKPALLIKYPHAKGTLTKNSAPVSHDDIQQTIFDVMDLGELNIGMDIREVKEDMYRDRVFLAYRNNEEHPKGYMPNIWEIHYNDTGFPEKWTNIYLAGFQQTIKEFSSVLPYDQEVTATTIEDKYLTKGFASWGDKLDYDNIWISDQAGGLFFRVNEKPTNTATLRIIPAQSAMANTNVTLTITCRDILLLREELHEEMPELDIQIPTELFDADGFVFLKFSFSPELQSTYTRWGVDNKYMNTKLDTFLLKSIYLSHD